MSDAERTQPASPQRRARAHAAGLGPRSRIAVGACVLLAAAGWTCAAGLNVLSGWADLLRDRFGAPPATRLSHEQAAEIVRHDLLQAALVVGWLAALVWTVALFAQVLQAGWSWTPMAAAPDWSRLNGAAGWSRLWSWDNVAVALGRLALAVVLGVLAGVFVVMLLPGVSAVPTAPLPVLTEAVLQAVFWSAVQLAAAATLLTGVDVVWRRWRFEQGLQMSDEEVRAERKDQRPVARPRR
jgi:flagellar biosynthetic protein FlhB